MKILGWMLLSSMSILSLHAQEVIESTPLSVEDDGARKIIEGQKSPVVLEAPKEIIKIEAVEIKPESLEAVDANTKKDVKKSAKVIVKKSAVIIPPIAVLPEENSKDGQLKLTEGKTEEIKIEDKRIDDKKIVIVPETLETEKLTVVFLDQTLGKYIQFSFGYLNSRYEKIHSSLDNGSSLTSFSLVSDMNRLLQFGFSMELLTDTSGQEIPDNIRVVQYRLFANTHAPILGSSRFDWVGGLAFSIGDFGIRRRYLNLQNEEASVKIKDGTIVGLIPAAGVRIYLVGKNSFDLMVEYHQYFGKPQSYIGGLAIAPRLSFEF